MSTPKHPKVVVKRRFNASAERVFDAWLDRDLIGQWMFGPKLRDETIVHLALDPRVGGRFSFAVRRGNETIDHVGEYLEIEPPRRLVFTWSIANADSSRVIAEIAAREPGCELTLSHELHPDWADYAERTRAGWTTMLHALESELTPRPSPPSPDGYASVIEPSTLRLERVLPGPIERVWAYLTESDKRAQWLASGAMDLRAGGDVELHFHHVDLSPEVVPTPERFKAYEGGVTVRGSITRCSPPRLLAFSWDEGPKERSEVTFELAPEGDAVRLVVTHRRLRDRAAMIDTASGWHAHLAILLDRLRGDRPRNFWRAHTALEAEYAQRL
jgi:uncharacterized protein YndB with AHSA1/START domain